MRAHEVEVRWQLPHEVRMVMWGDFFMVESITHHTNMRWMWDENGHARWLLHGGGDKLHIFTQSHLTPMRDGKVALHGHKVTLGEILPQWCPKHKWWRFSEISPYILLQSHLTWLFQSHIHFAWPFPPSHGHFHLMSTSCDQFPTSYVKWECPCKLRKGHTRWMWGENVHARWEMVMQGGHEVRMPMQGRKWSCEVRIWSHKMDVRWEFLYEVDARWECPHEVGNGHMRWTQGGCGVRMSMPCEVGNGHVRWMQGENVHARWEMVMWGEHEVIIPTWGWKWWGENA